MKKWFLSIGLDKWLHIVVCFVIVCMVAIVDVAEWQRPHVVAACIGAIVAFLVGVLKEIVWDFILGRGSFDLKDLLADLVGSAIGFFFVWFAMSLGGY